MDFDLQNKLEISNNLMHLLCKSRNFPNEINIHFTNDINSEKLKYLTREKTINEYSKMDHSRFNGTALPFENNGFHILINESNKEFYFTVVHECCHIIDYYEFLINFNNSDIEIEYNPLYFSFGYYSEFNARSTAHLFMLCTYKDINKNFNVSFEITELSKLIKENYKDYRSHDNTYELMQLLGRWYSIEKVSKQEFTLPHYKTFYKLLKNFNQNNTKHNLELLDKYIKTKHFS